MPLQKLKFRPGINREGTSLANEGGWFQCDKIRFRSGYPEKLGGWTGFAGFNKYKGVARSLWNWVTLTNFNLLGIGTNLKFYIEDGGGYYDITPIKFTSTLASNAFTTAASTLAANVTATSTSIQVTDASDFEVLETGTILIGAEKIRFESVNADDNILINCIRGYGGTTAAAHTAGANVTSYSVFVYDPGCAVQTDDFVTISLVTDPPDNVNGIPIANIEGNFQVTQVGNSSYVFDALSPATTGGVATNGAKFQYEITTGKDIYTLGTGWGAGPWSRGGWGSGYTVGIGQQLRTWTQANFGQILLFTPRGGPIYTWNPGSATQPDFGTRATRVTGTNVPTVINTILVSDATRITICFGCNDYGSVTLDPLLIRWSDAENYLSWTPAITNQAGSYRLSHGSQIISALQTRQEIVVWTDTAVYSMQYSGQPYIWSFNILADNTSIAGPNTPVTVNGVTYWMGADKFYVYSGRVDTLPCSLRQYVFEDINLTQAYQFFGGTNEGYNEIWWFYCSADSTVIDRYVIYNHLDRVWYYGTLNRSAWLDSPLRASPMAATYINTMVYQESGVDDNSTETVQPIFAYALTSDFDIGEGHNLGFVWRMVPDVTFDGSMTSTGTFPSVNFTIYPRANPGAYYGNDQNNIPPGGDTDNPLVTTTQSYSGVYHTYIVQKFTQQIYTRVRGRQMAFQISSNGLGTAWQLGTPRLDVRPDGRR
jgi:hypothetical protein